MRRVAIVILASVVAMPGVPGAGQPAAAGPKPGQIVATVAGMKMLYVPAGEFEFGSPADEKGHEEDEGLRRVRISRPLAMSATEVTQAQYRAVMGQRKGRFEGDDLPVEEISWKDAVAFCEKLSAAEAGAGKTTRKFRLPTEAEWEYACRAGSKGRFAGEDLDALAWYDDNSEGKTHAAGGKKPNAWGFFDMHGNVAEWCGDWYSSARPEAGAADPAGPAEGKARVVRGGSFLSLDRGCRSASRSSQSPAYQMKTVGFRVVMEL